MSCIYCIFWKYDGNHSKNDLLYGTCEKTDYETNHTQSCEDFEPQANQCSTNTGINLPTIKKPA